MKKLFVVAAFAVSALNASAIDLEAVFGLNFADQKISDVKQESAASIKDGLVGGKTGFRVGLNLYLQPGATLFVAPGVHLSMKSVDYGGSIDPTGNVKDDIKNVRAFRKSTAGYLEIPVHLGAKISLGPVAVLGSFGPYLGMGMFGKTEVFDTEHNRWDEKSTFGDDEHAFSLKRFDMGIGFKAGVRVINKLSLSVGYDFGLTDNNNNDYLKYKVKNRNLGITLGWIF